MVKFGVGYLSKKEVKNVPFIGTISESMGCIFVNRESSESKKQIVK